MTSIQNNREEEEKEESNILNELKTNANVEDLTKDKKTLETLDIQEDNKFWHKGTSYPMKKIYKYTRKNTSLYFVKCTNTMFIFDRIQGLIIPRNEPSVLDKIADMIGLDDNEKLPTLEDYKKSQYSMYVEYAIEDVKSKTHPPSSKSGLDLPGCIDILYNIPNNFIHIKFIKGEGNPDPCTYGEYEEIDMRKNKTNKMLQSFEKLFGKLFGILQALKFRGQIKLEDDAKNKAGYRTAPLRMIVGTATGPSMYTKYGFKYDDSKTVQKKIKDIKTEVSKLSTDKQTFVSAQNLINENPGLKYLAGGVHDLPMSLNFPDDNIHYQSDELGGGRKSRKSRKTRKNIKTKKVRKHQGITQTGGNTGRLKKGYRYSGKKLKSGLSQIIKCKLFNKKGK